MSTVISSFGVSLYFDKASCATILASSGGFLPSNSFKCFEINLPSSTQAPSLDIKITSPCDKVAVECVNSTSFKIPIGSATFSSLDIFFRVLQVLRQHQLCKNLPCQKKGLYKLNRGLPLIRHPILQEVQS